MRAGSRRRPWNSRTVGHACSWALAVGARRNGRGIGLGGGRSDRTMPVELGVGVGGGGGRTGGLHQRGLEHCWSKQVGNIITTLVPLVYPYIVCMLF